jgi:hypothetical protein
MTPENNREADRLAELERRVAALEHNLVTRDVLDDEIRSLERRLSELRESAEG